MKRFLFFSITLIVILSFSTYSWGFLNFGNKNADIGFGTTRDFVQATDKVTGYVEIFKNNVIINSVQDNLDKKSLRRIKIIGDLTSIISTYEGDIINIEGKIDDQKKGFFAPKTISFIIPGEYLPEMKSFTSYILTNSENKFYIYNSDNNINLIGPAAEALKALFPTNPSSTLKERIEAGISPSRATSISRTKLEISGVYSEKDGQTFLYVKKLSIPDMQLFKFYNDFLRIEGSDRPVISDDVKIFLTETR
ncbi:MAG: hypothetical protein C0601_05185 [Candidatus Muiribacterium halophilum]|uniref:Uncharacterized protein n=1 Tax=Muiribacterium halophilum TaxID=2053465 RepID=A0A2N5ZIG2_MUIH1|nr:MAG: hypothetical protein C0601_05185 [Candidatus Muirbacterium halophilum]